VWSHVPVSPADLPGSLGLGESLRVRVSPSLSESHSGLEHPVRDFGPRASVGIAPIIKCDLMDRARDQNSVFFHHIDGGRSRQGRDGGTPGAPAARSGTTAAVARASQRV